MKNSAPSISHIDLWNAESKLGHCKPSKLVLDHEHLYNWGIRCSVLKEGAWITGKLTDKGEVCYYLGEDWAWSSKIFVTAKFQSIFSCCYYIVLRAKQSVIPEKLTTTLTENSISVSLEEAHSPSDNHPLPDTGSSSEATVYYGLSSSDNSGDDINLWISVGGYCNIDQASIIPDWCGCIANMYSMEEIEPKMYKEEVTGKSCTQWVQAIVDELSALIDMGSFWRVKRMPDGNVLRLKHVFKLKRNKKGNIILYKDHCVVQGCCQVWGKDYFKTRSNVICKETFRFLCSMATHYRAKIYQADVKNAYPLSELHELIFVNQPEGAEFLDEARRAIVQLEDGEVLQLLQSLYGLKQARRNWEQMLCKILVKRGFTPCKMDPCL